PELNFVRPDGLVQAEVCTLSGLLPRDNCPLRRLDWFIDGTQPTEYDNVYQTFAIDNRTGALADDTTPPENVVLDTFVVLPQDARDWAVLNGINLPPEGAIPEDDSGNTVRLLSPDPYTNFEISPITPIETQRLRFSVATPSNTVSVAYYVNDNLHDTKSDAPFDAWWQLAVGEWEVVAEATLADGTTLQSESLYFTVVDYEPAQPRTVSQSGE